MKLITKLFHFVLLTTKKYSIDESHGLSHSMNILNYAHNIYNSEKESNPFLESQEKIIYVSAIVHDMCDKKYMDEKTGIMGINKFLTETQQLTPNEIEISKKIIETMSYSTVKRKGFPELNEYQQAYHIVREADLLDSYDFDRCLIYNMYKNNSDIISSFDYATQLFENRVFKHFDDGLLTTNYAIKQHDILKETAENRINFWRSIINNKNT